MPYNADLRSSYFSLELNMSWFYEEMTHYNEYFKFEPHPDHINENVVKFESYIEECFKDYTVWKLFEFAKNDQEKTFKLYDNVWEYCRAMAIEYCETHEGVKWCDEADDEEESEDEATSK